MSQKGGIVKFFALEDDTEFMIYEDLQPLPSLVPWSKRFQRTGTWKAIDMKVLVVGTVPCCMVAQRKPNFNMLRLIGAVQNQKKNELGHWVLVKDGHPSIQAY